MSFIFKAGSNVAEGQNEDEGSTLYGAALDASVRWVRLPVGLGNRVAHVTGTTVQRCEACGGEHEGLTLDHPTVRVVLSCPEHGFVWLGEEQA